MELKFTYSYLCQMWNMSSNMSETVQRPTKMMQVLISSSIFRQNQKIILPRQLITRCMYIDTLSIFEKIFYDLLADKL